MKTPIQKIIEELNIKDEDIITKYLILEKEVIMRSYYLGMLDKTQEKNYDIAVKYYYDTFSKNE